ncbi:fungal specific transcription [Stemphylium lycopersici]|uniref:Fungal specific transcription n=1 Tax=Stemphylium lycopersici TaxID=183478 RepID=A0A364NEW2_STELY|nr:fungal specific transcription [Stemphylium lycopersici]RAR15865.1 fungal specific transcription [Stemphylium lycopersici]
MLRRNGKLRSCEPCRVSKIRCDHATPTCEKCRARGMTEQCFYHPNPMTKPAGTPRKKPEPRRRKLDGRSTDINLLNGQGRLTSLTLSPPTLRNDADPVATSNTWPTPPQSATRTTQSGPDPARNFFLGSTSYASVFNEEQPLPDAAHEQPSERLSLTPSTLEMYFETHKANAIVGPLILSALPQLRKDMDQLNLAGSDVYSLYAKMTKNTARPMKVPASMRPSEFHTLFTGKNLRWETLGLVLVLAGSQAQYTSPNDPIFTLEDGKQINRDEFIEDVVHATNTCIHICSTHGAVNEIMLCLVYVNMIVVSSFCGDNYHGVWRRLGDSVSALYATGIHCEQSHGDSEPFFMREFRRRIYCSIYRSDKTLAVFYGRPPMMAWRYSDRKMLLDISDQAVVSEDATILNQELAKLDSAGWNTDKSLHAATLSRVWCQLAVFKERLLEQSLAGEKDSDVVRNVEAISAECTEWWQALPAFLRYETYTEDAAWNGRGPGITRLLHRITQQALPALLEVSLKLLATSIVSTKPDNGVYETRRHFPTVILFYCSPAAGLLALELRRCTIEGVSLPSTISRADVIRNLSVLTSCLEWIVLPGDGNHKLCSELNKMLALVLDEVLNYEPPIIDNQGNGEDAATLAAGAGQGFFDMPMIEGLEPIPTEAEEFLNWLDNATFSGASHVQPWPGLPTGCLDHGVIAPIPQKMRFTESVGVYPTLCLQRIVAPVLQIIVALTLGVLFGPFFLRYMSLAVRDHLSHMVNIILLIFAWMLLRVLRQDGNDAAPGLVPNRFAIGGVLRPARALGFLAAKPFFEFLGGHVDNVVELPVDRVRLKRANVAQRRR